MSEHTATPDDGDFLDSGVTDEQPPYGVPPGGDAATPAPNRWRAALRPTAWVAVGVVAGVVVVSAWHSSQSTSASANPAAQGRFLGGQGGPGGQGGQLPGNGQVPGGQLPGGPGGSGFGGRTGEQHVAGTVTAVGPSSVTVRLSDGTTATYGVLSSSEIVKDGAPVSLSAIKTGDAVFLHVYPANGRTVVERLFAGVRPGGGPPPPSGGSGPGTTTKT